MSTVLKTLSTSIPFGKIDYNGIGRKRNLVEMKVTLKINTNASARDIQGRKFVKPYYTFTASVDVWNGIHTDCIVCGQCNDDKNIVSKITTDKKLYNELVSYWKEYHLNDTQAGTEEQTEIVNSLEKYSYNAAVDLLREKNKLSVVCRNDDDVFTYTYGHGWLVKEIPDDIVKRIEEIITEHGGSWRDE